VIWRLSFLLQVDVKRSLPDPLFRKVDCLRLYVSDLEAGMAFYRDRLGHELIWRTEQAVGLRMPDSDAELVLHTEPQPPEIDLTVLSVEEAVTGIVEACGKVIVPPFDIQIGRCAVIEDPWGNRLVILDTSKGLLQTDADGKVIS
jgi:predicted enzyme related to lactoylglutathione lyase